MIVIVYSYEMDGPHALMGRLIDDMAKSVKYVQTVDTTSIPKRRLDDTVNAKIAEIVREAEQSLKLLLDAINRIPDLEGCVEPSGGRMHSDLRGNPPQ